MTVSTQALNENSSSEYSSTRIYLLILRLDSGCVSDRDSRGYCRNWVNRVCFRRAFPLRKTARIRVSVKLSATPKEAFVADRFNLFFFHPARKVTSIDETRALPCLL